MFETFATTPMQAIIFGLLTLPVTVWIIYTDVTEMKIKNMAVLATLAIFLVVGPFLMPLGEYGIRWVHFAVMLAVGYALSAAFGLGAGDMKYMAAVAPFIPVADLRQVAMLFVIWTIFLIVFYVVARRSSVMREALRDSVWINAVPEGDTAIKRAWRGRKSKMPFGVALAPTVTTYFFLAAIA